MRPVEPAGCPQPYLMDYKGHFTALVIGHIWHQSGGSPSFGAQVMNLKPSGQVKI